ncbi:type IV secretion system protein [Tabrizicola sp.]|uniref:type IV secretion system protein n=1 Tax=Tabrizicola sp. TaxID=2005166 RepID=UPI003F374297
MRRALLVAALLISTAAAPGPSLAQGVPTIDTTNLAKIVEVLAEAKLQLREMIAQNLKLDDQILKQLEQIKLLSDQLVALRQSLDILKLEFDPETFLRDILPDFSELTAALDAAKSGDWESVLTSGTVRGGPVSAHVDRFFEDAGLDRTTVDGLAASEDPAAARIGTAANTAAFLSVAAEASAEDASASLKRVDRLIATIPETDGLKEAIDLNTRVTAELAIALANIWSMEAAQVVGMGEAGVMDAATAAEERKFIKVLGEE